MRSLLLLCFAFLLFSCADDKWKPLFNGKDLSGWQVLGEDATFEVKGDKVIGTNKGRQNTFLATQATYGDFILELEVWVDPRMNSGIQFRSAQLEEGRVYGYQAEIDPSERAYSGGIYDEARRDWLYPLSLNPAGQKAFKNETWNKYRIEAFGTSMRVWVNGICTAFLEDDLSAVGFIALQVHGVGREEEEGRQVKWRNIRLLTEKVEQNLTPVPQDIHVLNLTTFQMNEIEEAQGWQWMWDPNELNRIMPDSLKVGLDEGVFHIHRNSVLNIVLGSDVMPTNFEVSFQYSLGPGSEYHMAYLLDQHFDGRRYQIVDPKKFTREESLRQPGAVEGLIAAQNLSYAGMGERYLKSTGNWNQGRIIVNKGNVQHWMNGFKVVEYELEEAHQGIQGRLALLRKTGSIDLRNMKFRVIQ